MELWNEYVRDFNSISVMIRLVITVLCGGAIGLEREYKRRAAGFRTHILICLGAAIAMLTSQYLYIELGLYTDVARLGAQVISGIGFIGAGVIIVTRERRIKGLTTAAGLWASATIGLACGGGYIECALAATLMILTAELLLIKLERKLLSGTRRTYMYIEYGSPEDINRAYRYLEEKGLKPGELELKRDKEGSGGMSGLLSLRRARGITAEEAAEELKSRAGISRAEII